MTTTCSDPAMAGMVIIVKNFITVLQIIIPILLIVSVAISFVLMMVSPDDTKKPTKALVNKIIAAVVIFFAPTLVNLIVGLVPDQTFSFTDCWNAASKNQGIISWSNTSTISGSNSQTP